MAPIPWSTRESVWQFNWIQESMCASLVELFDQSDRHLSLVLEGLRYGWFAIGMLKPSGRYLPFYYRHLYSGARYWEIGHVVVDNPRSDAFLNVVARPLMLAMRCHLTALASLENRIVTASGRNGGGLQHVSFAEALGFHLDLYLHLGIIDRVALASFARMASGDLARTLISLDVTMS